MNTYCCFFICIPAQKLMCPFNNMLVKCGKVILVLLFEAGQCGGLVLSMDVHKVCNNLC
jgi:hypothetical protein